MFLTVPAGGSKVPSLRLVAPGKPEAQGRDSESRGTVHRVEGFRSERTSSQIHSACLILERYWNAAGK